MGILSWLFGKKEATTEKPKSPHKTEVANGGKSLYVPISKVSNNTIPEGSTIVAESNIPEFCIIGNLVYEKRYKEAVELGLKQLKTSPNDCGVHINLMNAYFKGKEITASDYIERSSYHAKQAILFGHNTGYAEERLAKNLDKAKLYHQSLQLYNLILDTAGFHFSQNGCGNSIDWNHRRESILKKMDKALDTESDILFTPEEIVMILQRIKDNDVREEAERKANEESMSNMKAETAKKIAEIIDSLKK